MLLGTGRGGEGGGEVWPHWSSLDLVRPGQLCSGRVCRRNHKPGPPSSQTGSSSVQVACRTLVQ